MSKCKTLLVIGDGFDLHCGLKPSYKEFLAAPLRYGFCCFETSRTTRICLALAFGAMWKIESKNRSCTALKASSSGNEFCRDSDEQFDRPFRGSGKRGFFSVR